MELSLCAGLGCVRPWQVANNAVLARSLADSCTAFDWMRGDGAYKASMSNHRESAQELLA